MISSKKPSQSYSCCILEQIQLEDKQFLHNRIGNWAWGIGNWEEGEEEPLACGGSRSTSKVAWGRGGRKLIANS
jgi:hypothetical protein